MLLSAQTGVTYYTRLEQRDIYHSQASIYRKQAPIFFLASFPVLLSPGASAVIFQHLSQHLWCNMTMFLQDSLLAFSVLILALMLICCSLESLYVSRRASKGRLLLEFSDVAESFPLLEKVPVSAEDQVSPEAVCCIGLLGEIQKTDFEMQV